MKQLKLAEIAINQAVAISRAVTEGVGPGLAARIAVIAATTLAQIALVATQKYPAYAKGTEYVEGPGTGTSDSITAKLSKGERVVPAHINEQLIGIRNEDLPELLKGRLGIDTNIPRFADASLYANALKDGGRIDYEHLADLFAKKISKVPMVSINMDKAGFSLYQQKAGNKTKYLNNYYNG
jgi:hypothetical protein